MAIFLNYCLVSPRNTPHARARRVIFANTRSGRHVKLHISYFGYCRVPLNIEKIIILPIFFYKRGGLTRLWRNLPIRVKIARYNPFFSYESFKALKATQLTFPLVSMCCRNVLWDSQMPLKAKSAKMVHFAFSMLICTYCIRWMPVIIAVTKSFLGETIIIKYGMG